MHSGSVDAPETKSRYVSQDANAILAYQPPKTPLPNAADPAYAHALSCMLYVLYTRCISLLGESRIRLLPLRIFRTSRLDVCHKVASSSIDDSSEIVTSTIGFAISSAGGLTAASPLFSHHSLSPLSPPPSTRGPSSTSILL